MNEICAVVVTYNRKEKLEKCIHALQSQENACCDILVVDNGSSDGTEKMLTEKKAENIIYYNTGRNIGSAGGFSFGVKQGVLLGYKYLWIMDDDVYPEERALYELVKADSKLNGNWGCLSSYVYWVDGKVCKANRQKKGLFSFVADREYQTSDLIPIKIASFASMYVKSDIVRQIGLPISDYFFYTDDYEFSARISKSFDSYVVVNSRVLHDMGANIKANIVRDPLEKMYRYEHLYRNDVHFYKNYGFKGRLYLLAKFIYTFGNIILKEKVDKRYKLRILIKGIKDGFHFDPVIEKV